MPNAKLTARRVAFVTGASYGIGAATARALARDGYDIAVAATDVDHLRNTVAALQATDSRVAAVDFDLCKQASIERGMADVVKALGRIDVLVNNAGITVRRHAVDITRAEWDAVMR